MSHPQDDKAMSIALMKAAPRGAVYIVPNEQVIRDFKQLALRTNVLRGDLIFVSPDALLATHRFRGLHLQFAVDNATVLNEKHKAALDAYEKTRSEQMK